jgi:two-component system cell cycle sensor histidine kinase/response regulator CckA
MSVPLPPNERERLQALRRQAILDTPPEAAFDRIARLAARLLEVPIALVSFIDERRQWYKARHGAPWREVDRELSVCTYTILTDGLTIVPDLSRDRRFADKPYVTGPAHLRFYAGAPLKSADGFNIGTLCAIDTQSRAFGPEQGERLRDLAALTADELRLRLALAEGRLGAIVASAEDAILSTSLDGIITSWNAAAGRLFGYAPEEIVGRPGSLLIPLDRPDEEAQTLARLQRGERVSPFETVRRCKDGRLIDVSLTISAIRDGNGRLVEVSQIARDITERKTAEAVLQHGHAQLREQAAVLDLAPVLVRDLDSRIVLWTQGAQRLYGFSKAEALGRISHELFQTQFPESRQQVDETLRRASRWEGELVHRIRSGGRLVVASQQIIYRDASGRPARILEVNADLTERKRAEARLRDSEQRFQQLAQNIGELFWIWDREQRRILYVSPAYETICGRSCEELYQARPRAWLDTIHPEDRERLLRVGAEQRDAAYDEELRIVRPDGAVRWLHARAFPVREPGGPIKRVVGSARDITAEKEAAAERRRLEEQLRQAQKMEALGRLAGGVAHDFNNLLSVVFGHSALLALGAPSPERLRDSVAQIGRAAERAAALTRQLLAFSRRQVTEPEVLDLNALVTDAAGLLRRLLSEDVQVTTTLQPDLSPVRVDPGQMDQVILNLALNARDAMPRGGRLSLETRDVELDEASARVQAELRPGRYVLLAVTDTGCGMTPEVQARIFEPFFSTKGVGQGTGLGLSVVHGIVEQSGGHLEVYSLPGVGTTFKLYLPAMEAPPTAMSVDDPPQPPKGRGETVLLVEDEEPVREVTALMLASLGYRVLEASNGEEALRVAEAGWEHIDLLMTDVIMPGMGGRDLADALQARRPGLKVLFQSGYTGETVIRQGILRTEVAFLQKPFTLEALSQKLREVLDRCPS